jgi:pimeloyl-ACP methyl ester carboxylesterase
MLSTATTTLTFGDVELEVARRGAGPPLLLLYGEDALEPAAPFVDELARRYDVIVPSPPGFGRSNRPEWITDMDDVAYLYLDLVDRLDVRGATVLGFSLGGWIAAEMATKNDTRFAKLVLVAPYGIKVGGPTDRDIADIYLLHPDEVQRRKWHDPAAHQRDFKALPEDELRVIARNRESFARFCWEPYMHDPKLKHRLHRIGVPTLVVAGEADGITSPAYGRAFAELIPNARFATIPDAGHLPHIEQPERFVRVLDEFLAGR